MLNLRADTSNPMTRDALVAATGLSWPAACRFEARDDCTLAWLGPDEFLLIDDADAGDPASVWTGRHDPAWRAALGSSIPAITAVGAGYARLEIRGTGALDLLARGCALDLHPKAIGAGDCLGTMFARTPVTLLHRGAAEDGTPRIEMLARRSYADHVWRWLAAHG